MIDITHCPKCNEPLMNEYITFNREAVLRKHCKKSPNHQFVMVASEDGKDLRSITITLSMNPLVRAAWQFQKNKIEVLEGTLEEIIKFNRDDNPTIIPWFDPDFSDMNKLVKKLKMYVTFS